MASFLLPAAISAGSSIIGSLATDSPEVPDLSGRAREQVRRSRREQDEQQEEARQDLEESLASTGSSIATSAGAREDFFDSQASASAELQSRASEILQDAIRREKMLEFEQDQRRSRNRAGAISDIGSGLATAAIASDTDFGDVGDLFEGMFGDGGPTVADVNPGMPNL